MDKMTSQWCASETASVDACSVSQRDLPPVSCPEGRRYGWIPMRWQTPTESGMEDGYILLQGSNPLDIWSSCLMAIYLAVLLPLWQCKFDWVCNVEVPRQQMTPGLLEDIDRT